MYCPQCGDEYRAGFFTCAGCNIDLVRGEDILRSRQEEGEEKVAAISPDDNLVAVQKGAMVEIKRIQSILKKAGIPSITAADAASCGKGCCAPELLLQIREQDFEKVRAVLTQEHIHSTGLAEHDLGNVDSVFNTSVAKTTCPACGCRFSTSSPQCPDCGLCFA